MNNDKFTVPDSILNGMTDRGEQDGSLAADLSARLRSYQWLRRVVLVIALGWIVYTLAGLGVLGYLLIQLERSEYLWRH